MYKLFLMVILLSSWVYSQGIKKVYTERFFAGHSLESTVTKSSGDTDKSIKTTAAQADTIESNKVEFNQGGNAITIWGKISNLSGTMNTKIEIGVYGSSFYGYDWYEIGTYTVDSTFKFSIADQSWKSDVSMNYAIRITETGSQSNKIGWVFKQFVWR